MHSEQHNLFTRPDTFFGICEGLGEDLHIPADLLRVGLAGMLFWNPPLAIGAYLAAGVLVAATRFIFPNPAPTASIEVAVEHEQLEEVEAAEHGVLPLAA